MARLKGVLVALAALAVTATVLYGVSATYFPGAGVKTDILEVTSTSTLTGAVSAPGGVTGDLIGDVTGDITGDVTGAVAATTVSISSILTIAPLSGALPDTATATGYGDGHVLISVTGGTLFIWDDTNTIYDAVALGLTKVAN